MPLFGVDAVAQHLIQEVGDGILSVEKISGILGMVMRGRRVSGFRFSLSSEPWVPPVARIARNNVLRCPGCDTILYYAFKGM